jgi:hypothetical protein
MQGRDIYRLCTNAQHTLRPECFSTAHRTSPKDPLPRTAPTRYPCSADEPMANEVAESAVGKGTAAAISAK